MTHQQRNEKSRRGVDKVKAAENSSGGGATNQPPASGPDVPAAGNPTLTDDEQMALYEQELKENDWGHQPC